MRTPLQIANAALTKLGAMQITSFDNEVKEAKYVKQRLPEVLDFMLRDHTWSFAKTFAKLSGSKAMDIPPYWTFVFSLPTDSLRILSVEDVLGRVPYELMGVNLLANRSPIVMRYIAKPPGGELDWNVKVFPEDFAEAAACMLASELSHTLTGSQTMKDAYLADYGSLIRKARFNGSVERGTDLTVEAEGWISSRQHGGQFAQPNMRPLDYPEEGSPFRPGG